MGPSCCSDLFRCGFDGGGVGDVGGDEDGVRGAHRFAFVGCAGEGFGIAGEECDGVTAFGEGVGDGATKTSR